MNHMIDCYNSYSPYDDYDEEEEDDERDIYQEWKDSQLENETV